MKRISVLVVVCVALLAMLSGTALATVTNKIVLKEAGTPLAVGSPVTAEVVVEGCHLTGELTIKANYAHKAEIGRESPEEEGSCGPGALQLNGALGYTVMSNNGLATVDFGSVALRKKTSRSADGISGSWLVTSWGEKHASPAA